MSYGQEISMFDLPGFSLLNLVKSNNPFFIEFPKARNYAGGIRSAKAYPDAFGQIISDFTRGAGILIAGKTVTANDVIAQFNALMGAADEAEKVARAYSQTLAEVLISPLSNLDYMASKNLFSNLSKNSAGQIYFAACRYNFGVGGVNSETDKPNLNIPGEVLYIYIYNPEEGQFHLEYPLVSNPLLKVLYEENINIRSETNEINPQLKKSAADLMKKKQPEIQPFLLMQKIQQALDMQSLHFAALRGDLALVQQLVGKVTLAQTNLNNVCEIANNANHPRVVAFLKEKGAKLDKQSAFFFAAEKNDLDSMRNILKTSSIKINATTKVSGNTALHFAAIRGTTSAIGYLLAQDAAVNQTNKQGETPLHLAVQNGCLGAVNALLQGGADATLKNHCGKSPFELINISKNPALERFIKAYQENTDSVQKIYAIFNDIKALPYQYCGHNKQRIEVINTLIKQVQLAELHLISSEKPPNKILQNLKDAVLTASQAVNTSHPMSSFAFFRFIAENIIGNTLAELLSKIMAKHEIKPPLSMSIKAYHEAYHEASTSNSS